jgi:N-acetylglucosaminyldiphosphoundecaprenol N-acetyl-beta-D-mannosaminyltransferase
MSVTTVAEPTVARSYRLLGVRVHALSIGALTDAVAAGVRSGEPRIIANHNLHSVYLHHRDAKLRAFYRLADLVHVDGMSIIAAGRLLGLPLRREHRVTYVDWIDPLLATAAGRAWRVMSIGQQDGVAQRGAAAWRRRHPGLVLEALHGFFDLSVDGKENRSVLRRIHHFEPHVLMVGMGMPRQEHWIYDNLSDLPPCVLLTAGAAIGYAAGSVPTPPRWAGAMGMEWAFRLFAEPRRLWRRYLLEPWAVLAVLVRELIAGSARRRREWGRGDE